MGMVSGKAALRAGSQRLVLRVGVVTELGKLPVIGQAMGNLSGVTDFLNYTGAAAQSMQTAVNTIQTGVNSGSIGTWLDSGSALIEQAADGLNNAAKGAQALTGWLASRKDGGTP